MKTVFAKILNCDTAVVNVRHKLCSQGSGDFSASVLISICSSYVVQSNMCKALYI